MRRRFSAAVLLAAISAGMVGISLAACNGADTTAPSRSSATASANYTTTGGAIHDGHLIPGSNGKAGLAPSASKQPLPCNVVAPLSGSAIVGPRGGTLDIGPHRLTIPAGALTVPTRISGSIDAGPTVVIHFQPTGLQFKKPAGLIFDASSCGQVPNALYFDELGGQLEVIPAVFSNWWHTIAAPIDHFSNYALEV